MATFCAGLAFLSYGSWVTPELRPLRVKAAVVSFVLLALGGLLLILLLQRLTVNRALRPLEQARRQIAQLQQGQRAQRFLALDGELGQSLRALAPQGADHIPRENRMLVPVVIQDIRKDLEKRQAVKVDR